MYRKMFISVLLIISLLATSMVVYADKKTSKNNESTVIEIINNLDGTKTFEKSFVLCGRAKEGTVITFQQFWFKSSDDKAIVSRKKSSDNTKDNGEWILQESDEWTIGASGIFAKPVTWINGRNKLALVAVDKDSKKATVVMEVELVSKQELKELINSHIINNIDSK